MFIYCYVTARLHVTLYLTACVSRKDFPYGDILRDLQKRFSDFAIH